MALGVPGRLRPRIFSSFGTTRGGRSSAKRTGRLYPKRNLWYSFSEAESTSEHMVLSEEIIWAGHVARIGEKRGVYRVLVGKPEGKVSTWKDQAQVGG